MNNDAKQYMVMVDDLVTELRKPSVEDDKGVYFIFSARRNGEKSYEIVRLLYIGRSNDVNSRVNKKHHKHDAILAECKKDNAFPVYYYAEVAPSTNDDLVRVESALIYNKQPCLNETADKNFHHPDSHIVLQRVAKSANASKALPKAFGDVDFVLSRTAK